MILFPVSALDPEIDWSVVTGMSAGEKIISRPDGFELLFEKPLDAKSRMTTPYRLAPKNEC